jgi:hypothetical protein
MVRKFVGFVVLATALAAPMFGAASLTLAGSTVGQPTFNRPFTDGSALSGHIVPYKVQNFFPNEDSTCFIYGTQSFDGVVFLYDGQFDPLNPLTNLLTADDDGDVGIGSSTIESQNLLFVHNYVLVTTSFEEGTSGTFANTIQCGSPASYVVEGFGSMSNYDGLAAEFRGGRFEITATWSTGGSSGNGTFVPLASDDSGLLWFFDPANFEVLIKVLDGCVLTDHYWVYLAATTDVGFDITVRDELLDHEKHFLNTLGHPANAVTDVFALPCH